MPSNGEKRAEQQHARCAKRSEQQRARRAKHTPTRLSTGLTWHSCHVPVDGVPLPEGRLVVIGQQKRKIDDVEQLSAEAPPRLPWSKRASKAKYCSVHYDWCNVDMCTVVKMQRCLLALARKPFLDTRRKAFEEACKEAKSILECAPSNARQDDEEPPYWFDAYIDPWASDAPSYPRYDGPYHVLLRDEPRHGHVWVSQPDEIEIEFSDGGPPKLKEWQIPEHEVDASYIELPWRVPRRVLELSGAHEAEKRGDYVCRRLDRSKLPEPCPHCWHTTSCCRPRCHPPHPLEGLRCDWERQGYCSKLCGAPSRGESRCDACYRHDAWRMGVSPARTLPHVQRWLLLYGGADRCRCCSSAPSAEIRALEWAEEICSEEYHKSRIQYTNWELRQRIRCDWSDWRVHMWYLDERRAQAYDVLVKARADAVSK